MKKVLQKTLLNWFSKHQRQLPWRSEYNPYYTWIAEIMMQQTQMDRGVEYYQRWIKRFPNIEAIVKANEEELLKYWEGLGYYRRVRNIKKAALNIVNEYGGVFPNTYNDIIKLTGVGAYTAGAIASTVFNEDVPSIDANVERVLTRVFDINTSIKKEPTKTYLYTLCKQLIPKGKARYFNQAIMEFGALVCRKNPLCTQCPIQIHCKAKKTGTYLERPVNNKRATLKKIHMVTGILEYNESVFIQRRHINDVWGGLWEFPGGCIKNNENPEEALIREWKEELGFSVNIAKDFTTIQHKYTNYNITLSCFIVELSEIKSLPSNKSTDFYPKPNILSAASEYKWVSRDQITNIPLPSPHRKLASLYFTGA